MVTDTPPSQLQAPESHPARRFPPMAGLILGGLVGVSLAWFQPVRYRAEVSVYFPGINSSLFRELTQVLRVDPVESTDASRNVSDPRVLEAAQRTLTSRAALSYSLNQAKVAFTTNPLLGDPVEYFRRNNLHLESNQLSTLKLSVDYVDAEQSRLLCQGLLDYYTQFVKNNALTNTSRARRKIDAQLKDIEKQLVEIERKLSDSADDKVPWAGDSQRPDLSVLREVWRKRLSERGQGHRILKELRKIRAANAGPSDGSPSTAETPTPPADWLKRWGPTGVESNSERLSQRLPGSARKADIPSRLKLERNYEQLLMLYQAASLQNQFLSIWETLESFDFEIVDPIAVSQLGRGSRVGQFGLIGALLGLLLALTGNRILRWL